MFYFRRVELRLDQSVLSVLQNVSLLLVCIYCMYVFWPDPTVKIEPTTMRSLHQIVHIMLFFVLIRSMCLFSVKRQLHKMLLRSMRRLGGIIWARVRNTTSLSLLCTSRSNVTTATTSSDWSWGWTACMSSKFSLGDKSWPSVLFSPLKTISDMKGVFLYLEMYIKWCQQHPGGQSRVPMETESGCCARRPDTPLSGGSVMALSFSRHVSGSFDTGNMHAGWQCLGCAAETMMYISFSSLTDWRL